LEKTLPVVAYEVVKSVKVVGKDRPVSEASLGAAPGIWTPSDSASLAEVVCAASEAVTTLADRLNALALRTALLGGAADRLGAEANLQSYLHRLSSLVDLAGEQMGRIQNVLHILEATTCQTRSRKTAALDARNPTSAS
jgi:hypothetical protein